MEYFNNLWNNVSSLKAISSFLQWFSIILIFIGGFLQITKQVIDRKEKQLVEKIQGEKEKQRLLEENTLKTEVNSLKDDLGNKVIEIDKLKEKAKYTNPYEQPIHSGTSKIIINIKSTENINAHFMDRGAILAFGKDRKPILIMSSIDSFGNTVGSNVVVYSANLNLDANDVSIGKLVKTLKEAQLIQLQFACIPNDSQVLSGNAICTINGIVRFEISIPSQKVTNNVIISTDLSNSFKDFK